MSVQLPNNGLKLDVAALRIRAISDRLHRAKIATFSPSSTSQTSNLGRDIIPDIAA
jgi:hypothetical protein